jgi:predicted metal-binding protein
MIKIIPLVDLNVRGLCTKPYPNHPKGCPNYGKKETCPPKCPELRHVLNLYRPIYAVYAEFNFGQHVKNMYKKHPEWTYRQASCCLYWQGSVRSKLKKYAAEQMRSLPGTVLVTCPEAAGVNVTKSMRQAGVTLEWPPKNITRMVYLIGDPR